MIIGLRIVLALLGVLFLFIGAQFLIDPVTMGGNFGLEAQNNAGLASLRGDMTSFFWVSGGAILLGVWKKRGELFYITASLMAIVFSARCLSLILDGSYDDWLLPMVVEAVTVVLCLLGARMMRGLASA
ncbi:MAG: DUF4345 family protein [Pseudomonadota bacterium]